MQSSRSHLSAVLAGTAVALAAAGLAVVTARADDEDERVEDLMEEVHDGKRSPYRALRAQAEAANPAWQVVAATLPAFDAMSRALAESPDEDVKGSADGYVDSVAEIVAAARARDPKGLRGAVESLSQTCGDCHFDGGVGGELDD